MLEYAKKLSLLAAARMDAVMAMAVVGIVFMMILPMPTWIVDILIAINISISALLLVLSLYLPGPLAFSTFPAFLLVTTLFRLGLSITTTRLILLQADAGQIVEAFGNFVVGGNLVVGIVIFLILLIVNFLVITKGSERVAEVSARFTLDAMPGKQMSIDSDLRGGLLDPIEAQTKRKSLAKESQLFGAMDGAMKFVKGDAIAGIIIVMVNIIGGYSIGTMQQGMAGGDAIKLYAILTIGDGLVAQIPTLLIALSAGFIITRVKDDVLDTTNVGKEMSQELTAEPKAWILASIVLVLFSLVPGMPASAFLGLTVVFAFIGGINIYITSQEDKVSTEVSNEEVVRQGTSDVANFDVYEPLTMLVNPKYFGTTQLEELKNVMRQQRNLLVANSGYILPKISFQVISDLEEDNFQFRFYEVVEVSTTLDIFKVCVSIDHKEQLEKLNIEYEIGREDRQELDLLWVHKDHAAALESNEIQFKTCFQLIGEKVRLALQNEGYQFIGIDSAHKVMIWIAQETPELSKELERILSVTKLSEILKNLVRESVSLRSLRKIVELIVKFGETERDTVMLTEMVRMGLKEQLSTSAAKGETLSVCLFDPEYEELLRSKLRKTAVGGYIELDEEEKEGLIAKISDSCSKYLLENKPIAVVVAQDIRPFLFHLLSEDMRGLPILAYTELSNKIKVDPVCRITY